MWKRRLEGFREERDTCAEWLANLEREIDGDGDGDDIQEAPVPRPHKKIDAKAVALTLCTLCFAALYEFYFGSVLISSCLRLRSDVCH